VFAEVFTGKQFAINDGIILTLHQDKGKCQAYAINTYRDILGGYMGT